jgi:hypothetical protein
MPIYQRANARYSYPVRLRANIFAGGQFFDPVAIERIEIWKFAETEADGGVLVDTVDGIHAINDGVGQYSLIWDPYLAKTSPGDPGSPLLSPGVQGPGSPDQSPTAGLATIEPQCKYCDLWFYTPANGEPEFHSTGLSFYLNPDVYFVESGYEAWRFELKLDRKQVVKGENLDVRLRIIPIPLYRALREPIVEHLLPIATMRVRMLSTANDEIVAWTDIEFTGKEGIWPTSLVPSSITLGAYVLQVELGLPNGQTVRYPKQMIQIID